MEKFKERNVGKGSIIPEPKFEFKKPVFRKKLDLPKASDIKTAKEYLEKEKIRSFENFTLHISLKSG